MDTTPRASVAVAALALSTIPFVLAAPAGADTPTTKAGIEHAERVAAGSNHPTKAQIEQRERAELTTGRGSQQPAPSSPSPSGDTGAAAWQLALSAAFGAVLTGGVVVASRQVTSHRHAVAH